MMWPPSLIRILVHNEEQHGVNLWLPVIILWPLALVLGIALAPVALIVACCTWRRGLGKSILFGGPRLFALVCALRGLQVHVQEKNQRVLVEIR